jgi:hypothetical protein
MLNVDTVCQHFLGRTEFQRCSDLGDKYSFVLMFSFSPILGGRTFPPRLSLFWENILKLCRWNFKSLSIQPGVSFHQSSIKRRIGTVALLC